MAASRGKPISVNLDTCVCSRMEIVWRLVRQFGGVQKTWFPTVNIPVLHLAATVSVLQSFLCIEMYMRDEVVHGCARMSK